MSSKTSYTFQEDGFARLISNLEIHLARRINCEIELLKKQIKESDATQQSAIQGSAAQTTGIAANGGLPATKSLERKLARLQSGINSKRDNSEISVLLRGFVGYLHGSQHNFDNYVEKFCGIKNRDDITTKFLSTYGLSNPLQAVSRHVKRKLGISDVYYQTLLKCWCILNEKPNGDDKQKAKNQKGFTNQFFSTDIDLCALKNPESCRAGQTNWFDALRREYQAAEQMATEQKVQAGGTSPRKAPKRDEGAPNKGKKGAAPAGRVGSKRGSRTEEKVVTTKAKPKTEARRRAR